MAVKKRGDHWHYDFTIRGVRYREAIPEARTQSQAIRAETQAREEVYNGKFRKRDHTPKLADFIDETYLPWSKKNKPSWYDDELIIKHVIKPALGAKRLDLDNEVISYMTKEEEARLLRHCAGDREHLRAIVLIAVNTGMRTKEMFNLRKYQLDFNLNRIVIGHRVRGLETTKTKTGKGRIIPMNSIVREELLKLAQGKGDLEYLSAILNMSFTRVATGTEKRCGGISCPSKEK